MKDVKVSATKRFVGSTGWMIAQQIYSMLLSVVIGALAARYLGPSNYGLLNYGTTIVSFFTIVSKLGFDSVIVVSLVRRPEKRGEILGSALFMRLMASLISWFLIIGVVRVIEPGNRLLHVVTLLQSFAVILQSYEVFTYWFQFRGRMRAVAVGMMTAQTVVGIFRIFLLASTASVQWFALSSSVQYLTCGIIVAITFFAEKDAPRLKFDSDTGKGMLRESYHFIISGLAITFYTQIDKVMLGKMEGDYAVGIYTAAAAVAIIWEFVPNAIINAARPIIVEKKAVSEDSYIRVFKLLLLGITFLGIVVDVIILIFGKFAVSVLYGAEYIEACNALYILVFSTNLAVIGTARGIWIVAEGYNKYTKYYVLIGAGVNFALNLIFIRILGIQGAAIATLISQGVVALGAPLLFKKTRSFVKIYFQSFALTGLLFSTSFSFLRKFLSGSKGKKNG